MLFYLWVRCMSFHYTAKQWLLFRISVVFFLEYVLLKTLLFCDLLFFFQAEDGIRDGRVTGVQTCALPILPAGAWGSRGSGGAGGTSARAGARPRSRRSHHASSGDTLTSPMQGTIIKIAVTEGQIGRAACRGKRRERWVPAH